MSGHIRDVLLAALKAGPIYAGPQSPFWDELHEMARQGLCHGEFVPFDGWMWSA
jgi:hypothetical protein